MKALSAADRKVIKRGGVNASLAKRVLSVVDQGLVHGLGEPEPGEMCVEAAVAYAYGEAHGDEPKCVASSLRDMKIELNDAPHWKDDADRAKGMRRLAIAQLGSKGVFDEKVFWTLMNNYTLPRDEAKKTFLGLRKKIDNAIAYLPKMTTNEEIREALGEIAYDAESAQDNLDDTEIFEDINEFIIYRSDDYHELAEKMVQCLIKMKMPGTKYLYLTEKKKAKKAAKKPVKAKTKKKKTTK